VDSIDWIEFVVFSVQKVSQNIIRVRVVLDIASRPRREVAQKCPRKENHKSTCDPGRCLSSVCGKAYKKGIQSVYAGKEEKNK
ncbi:AAEL002470-PA, partial [Aedes aegypti]